MFKKDKWLRSFAPDKLGKYIPCPRCERYELQVEKGSPRFRETRDSKVMTEQGAPFLSSRFTADLECRRCKESVAVCGEFSQSEDIVQVGEDDYERYVDRTLTPRFILPAPQLFTIPSDCPKTVADALRGAFGLYWSDVDACAARLRTTVELMLDAAGVKRSSDKGAPIFLSTRLKEFKTKNESVAKMLEAAKLLGDESVHELGVKPHELDDAMNVISFICSVLYESVKYQRLAEAMVERKKKARKKEAT